MPLFDSTRGLSRGAYSDRAAHKAIQCRRGPIELDPKHPVIICGRRGRWLGYWILID